MNLVDIGNFTEGVKMPLRIYVPGFYRRKVLGIIYELSSAARSQPGCLVSLIRGQMNRPVKNQKKKTYDEKRVITMSIARHF